MVICMLRLRLVLSSVIAGTIVCVSQAMDTLDVGAVVRVSVASGPAIVGEVLAYSNKQVDLLNLRTLKQVTVPSAKQTKYPQVLTNQEVITAIGLPAYFAWQIQRNVKSGGTGKVAEIAGTTIYVTIPRKSGTEVGQSLRISRDEGAIKDPETGEVLSVKRTSVATLQVTEVEERLCKCKLAEPVDAKISIGDFAELMTPPRKVALLPLAPPSDDGSAAAAGDRFVEQTTTMLVEMNVPVVERSQLDKVLGEVSLQQTKWFEPEAAAKVGKQLGAFAVLTGSMVPQGKVLQANVRLVRVDTGEILASGSAPLQKLASQVPSQKRATATFERSAAPSSQVQDAWARPVTLRRPYPASHAGAPTDRISLQYAVLEILQQAGLNYDFNGSRRTAANQCSTYVTPDIQSKPCRVALEELLAPFPVKYQVNGTTITLVHK